MDRNGRVRIPNGVPMPPDVPAPEPTPAEVRAKADRAERRRDRWELAWAVTVLVCSVVIAAAAVFSAYWIRETAEVLAVKLR